MFKIVLGEKLQEVYYEENNSTFYFTIIFKL